MLRLHRLASAIVATSFLFACESDDAGSKPTRENDAGPVDAGAADAQVADAGAVDGVDAAALEASRLPLEMLQDPATCAGCHPKQYADWRGSMHAYASKDPVFVAMNQRGQRETDGGLGDFCVKCHAPMALHEGATTNGLNLDALDDKLKGVTCYYCHNVAEVGDDHFNANLTLADDKVMRGSIKNAVDPGVHGVSYSEAHDSREMKAAFMCGTCHDVVNPLGLPIERTLAEYRASTSSLERGLPGADSCGGCHMPVRSTDYIATPPPSLGLALKKRDLHDHRFAAVDVALTDFPDREEQKTATLCALQQGAFVFSLLNNGQGGFDISLEAVAGHNMPSGTAQDRRMWLEVIAYDASDQVVFQSGVIGDQDIEEYELTDPRHDSQLCMFRDHFENDAGIEVHMFWEAAKLRTNETKTLPFGTDPNANHVATCHYKTNNRQQPARLTARLMMRPVGMDVLQDLVDSGDLDASVKAAMPTFEVPNTSVEWKLENGGSLDPIIAKPTPGLDCSSL